VRGGDGTHRPPWAWICSTAEAVKACALTVRPCTRRQRDECAHEVMLPRNLMWTSVRICSRLVGEKSDAVGIRNGNL
jgi:hypothetical protein